MYNDYSFEYYMQDELLCRVFVKKCDVRLEVVCNRLPLLLPFGLKTDCITLKDLDEFYEDRCFPRERGNCRELLKELGVDYYEPELICRKTHGLLFDDLCWIKFSDTDSKDLTFDDINVFKH